MMPPGHIATTWAVALALQKKNSKLARLDYRGLAVASMLPDLIDKPLAVSVFTEAETSQLVAHSVLVHAVVLVGALLFRRKSLPYVLAFNGHLLLDRMWRHTESFWWPLFGWNVFWRFKAMNTPESMVSVYLDIITRYPRVWIVEIIAIATIMWVTIRHRLYRRNVFRTFLSSGSLHSAADQDL
ncbi:MAG TPA: metal-dependent hydrolase [Anaerolineae bacterium]|nr:metal-dependent hydrolase [Anaerolineae bacterium]HRV92037.1 metal-dependent hydrolase [Anaerolineae bacterium]